MAIDPNDKLELTISGTSLLCECAMVAEPLMSCSTFQISAQTTCSRNFKRKTQTRRRPKSVPYSFILRCSKSAVQVPYESLSLLMAESAIASGAADQALQSVRASIKLAQEAGNSSVLKQARVGYTDALSNALVVFSEHTL